MSSSLTGRGRLRIIGGLYRGRKLPVPQRAGLRPTADRVRETLFNWLQPVISGCRCLDLFAGTGALGFEAASRGAAQVVLIERCERLAQGLRVNARALGAGQIRVLATDALRWLRAGGEPFDVVFLDPPFDQNLLGPSCALLDDKGWLGEGALVYLEMSHEQGLPELPFGWSVRRHKRAGGVQFALASVQGQGACTEQGMAPRS